MANIHLARLSFLTKINFTKYTGASPLTGYVSKRYLQEFPELKYDNKLTKDYVLILPESLNETTTNNELLKLPSFKEDEINFSKINTELAFKATSQTILDFGNFILDFNNGNSSPDKPIKEFLKDVEQKMYPMDVTMNMLIALLNIDQKKYCYKEIYDLVKRYYETRDQRFEGKFEASIHNYILQDYNDLSATDKKVIQIYHPMKIGTKLKSHDESMLRSYKNHLRDSVNQYQFSLNNANRLFSHTVDDPDILAAVSADIDDCHHKERTPLKVTNETYHRFMQLCPDRFVRHMLWQTRNKRCSPKAMPKFNNMLVIGRIRSLRRQIADLSGYQSHIEVKLKNAMAESRQQILDNLTRLNEQNLPKLKDRLQELNDYAADNQFEDPNRLGIQEYDVDYWSYKYMYDILIGKSEKEVRNYFGLNVVLKGLQDYFKNYYDINLEEKTNRKGCFWDPDVREFFVSRKDNHIGTIIYDPHQRAGKVQDAFYSRIRSRNGDPKILPIRLISTSFKVDPKSSQAHLSLPNLINLTYLFGTVIQRLLYNYEYYELNTYGALEVDVNNLLPALCVTHLLTDHKILQSFSDRGTSKPIDTELASRIVKALSYFKSFRTWHELYKAHLDIEINSNLAEIKSLAQQIYSIYSPFHKDQDNYDFCAMNDIFVGPRDGVYYAELWSRQLATFCLSGFIPKDGNITTEGVDTIKDFNCKLIDSLFASDELDTKKKLVSLVGRCFEPTKADLGVL